MTTRSQAKNFIGRALLDTAGIRFPASFEKRCRKYFKNACCYCETEPSDPQHGHFDHATPVAARASTFHLVYACRECNSHQKLGMGWEEFLRVKCEGDEELFQIRQRRILDWFAKEPPLQLDPKAFDAFQEARRVAITGFEAAVDLLQRRLAER